MQCCVMLCVALTIFAFVVKLAVAFVYYYVLQCVLNGSESGGGPQPGMSCHRRRALGRRAVTVVLA